VLPDTDIPAEVVPPPIETADTADYGELPLPSADEAGEADEAGGADDEDAVPEIWKRAEETLSYLDTPVNPDLPEPEYVPEDEPATADAEPLPGLEESAESPAEMAAETETPPDEEADGSEATEEITAEEPPPSPPPPAILQPPREMTAAPPPRTPVSVPPKPLAMQPARVPPNETEQETGSLQPARTIRVSLGDNAEVPLPGSGWVYVGEADNQKGLPYRQRRLSPDGQVFVFHAETAGSYRLKFKKQDVLRGTDIDEIVEVVAVEKTMPEEPVSQIAAASPSVEEVETVPEEPSPAEPHPSDTAAPAVQTGTDDAALWNRGQELEAPGPNRDIKGALTAYKTLIRDYPQSEHYADSQKRIAYLERFFVNIR
jgi:hypothetical protein